MSSGSSRKSSAPVPPDFSISRADLGCTPCAWPDSAANVSADVRDGLFGEAFDLVMMIYGQFNVFPRNRGLEILKRARAALKPGGVLLLEVQALEQIQRGGETGPSWYSAQSGLFSGEPHLVLQENFWDADAKASTNRFTVINAQTSTVSCYSLSNEAYRELELSDTLRMAGFAGVESFPSLSGKAMAEGEVFPVVVARTLEAGPLA